MSSQAIDQRSTPDPMRRRLLVATTAVGVAGLGLAAVPFLASMGPSARTRAAGAPVTVDASKLESGQLITVEWQGKPVWLLRRTPAMLDSLERDVALLVDPASDVTSQQPDYAHNTARAIRPDLFVVIALCTHLGCVPDRRLEAGTASGLGADWPGGFFCPCHGSKFDLAGRVFKNVPAPTNLVVPPYRFLGNELVEVGRDPDTA